MSKARNLSDFISTATIDSSELADLSVTHAKLHATMDLTSKTVTLANDAISGNNVHGGVISNFASTGIDDNSSATAITILSDGKVGIGTNNPSGPLIVHGNSSNTDAEADLGLYNHFLNTNTNVNTGSAIVLGSNSNPGTAIYAQRIGSNNEHKMGFQTRNSSGSSTTRMTILGSGNVGIGTASPDNYYAKDLVVNAADEGGITIVNGTSQQGYFMFADGTSGAQAYRGYIGYDHNGDLMQMTSGGILKFLVNNNAQAMIIDTSGRVTVGSIGTDTTLSGGQPGFQVTGSGFNGYMAAVRRDSGPYSSGLILAKSRSVAADNFSLVQDNDQLGGIIFIGDDGTNLDTYGATIQAEINGTPAQNNMPTDLIFSTNPGNATVTERLRIMKDGNIRVGGGGSVDSANTQFNMEFPATGGINFGSGYTFSNIYGDASGSLYIKANAYPANTGSASKVSFRAANSGGGMSRELCWYNNGSLGLGVAAPSYSVDIEGAGFQNATVRMTRTDGGTNNDSGIVFKRNAGTANGQALGGLWFINSNYGSGDDAYALIRARTQEVGSSAKLQFMTSNGVVTNSTPAKMTINHAGDILYGGQFNFHVISGFSAPNVAFQYDFYRATYGMPIKITAAITHWNSSYMSYTDGMYWGFNTSMTSNVFHSYNGGNGSWTISFPTNNIVRVRMNGDASYNYASGWYIKVEGNLRREYTSS